MTVDRPRILVAPLDWGLGHTTRCIPLISGLLEAGADVWLAGNERQQHVLQAEFPNLPFLFLKGYGVRYTKAGHLLAIGLFRQAPRILRRIREEHQWLRQQVQQHGFQAVISDNRFGLWHPGILSILLTHQLQLKAPFRALARRINYRYINRFTECWIPDQAAPESLAGVLSDNHPAPAIPTRYVGWLSRLQPQELSGAEDQLLISLSGPEPQRTVLEEQLLRDIAHYPGKAVVVRGVPESARLIPSTGQLRFYNHLPAEAFNREIARASLVISRSGYSTVMDLAVLQKKSVLVPTPGQSEQEYLADYLTEKKWACCLSPKKFSLPLALEKAASFSYLPFPEKKELLEEAVRELIQNLRRRQ